MSPSRNPSALACSIGHVFTLDVALAPGEEYHGVDDEGGEEVHDDATEHDDEALPCGVGAELPAFAFNVFVADDDIFHHVGKFFPEALLAVVLVER